MSLRQIAAQLTTEQCPPPPAALSGQRPQSGPPRVPPCWSESPGQDLRIKGIRALGGSVTITEFVVKADHLEDLVRLGTLTRPAVRFLEASVVAGLNILVAGGTQSGKPTSGKDTPIEMRSTRRLCPIR
jgi:hypothetical protein